MPAITARLFSVLLVVAFLLSAVSAQGDKTQSPSIDESKSASQVDAATLRLDLQPLTKAELEAQCKLYQAYLKTTVTALNAAKKNKDTSTEGTLAAQRDRLLKLTNLEVIKAARAKGVDVKEYEAYTSALSGLDLGGDPNAIATRALNWVKSPEGGIRWGLNLLKFVLVLLAFRILAGFLARIVKRAMRTFKQGSELLQDFFVNVVRKLTFLIGLIVALSMIEVDIGPFLAAIGAAGFVIGFALQGTLSNFAAGIMILLYRPYDLGNVVDVGGTTGKVEAMSLVSTTLRKPDNQVVIVPNGSIWGGIITNITGSPTRRVDMVFGIGYDDDIRKAQAILEELTKGHPKVLDDPEPTIRVHELADSSVNFIVRPWAKTDEYWDVYFDLTQQVKERFDKEGISIPYPQTDVHVHQVAAS